METKPTNLSVLLVACFVCIGLSPSLAVARTPARQTCGLTKAEKKEAVKQAKKLFPKAKKLKAADCRCSLPDCELKTVTVQPFRHTNKKQRIAFSIHLEVDLESKKSEHQRIPDDSGPVDLKSLGVQVRKDGLVKRLFKDQDLECKFATRDSVQGQVYCGPKGVGAKGANMLLNQPAIAFNKTHKSLEMFAVSMPVKHAERSLIDVYDDAMNQRWIRRFVETYPEAWLRLQGRKLSLDSGAFGLEYQRYGNGTQSFKYWVPASFADDYLPGWYDNRESAKLEVDKLGADKAMLRFNGRQLTVESR